MTQYRNKPVVIDAFQTHTSFGLTTIGGTMYASPGDWIITGYAGERYLCKPYIFAATYEEVTPPKPPTVEEARAIVTKALRGSEHYYSLSDLFTDDELEAYGAVHTFGVAHEMAAAEHGRETLESFMEYLQEDLDDETRKLLVVKTEINWGSRRVVEAGSCDEYERREPTGVYSYELLVVTARDEDCNE